MDKYRVFCEKYPEYCSEMLFEKLFSNVGTLAELMSASDGTVMKVRAIVVGVEKRVAKSGKQYYALEICDKDTCSWAVYFGDKDIDRGDDIVAKARVSTWKGTRDVRIEDFEVLGNVYEIIGNDNEQGKENSKNEHNANHNVGRDGNTVADSPMEKFKLIMAEALNRGVKVKLDKAHALARKLGLKWDEVESIVEIYEEQAPNSLERIKYVRLKGC